MRTIKTLSDFKKQISVGTKVSGLYHMVLEGYTEDKKPIWGTKDNGTREVSISQSNSFALKTVKSDGRITDSWCEYPKASQIVISDNKMVVMEEDHNNPGARIPVLTYWIED